MAGIRGIGDGYAFQRLLWLLVGLVIAPTILLALYGVSAIRNQNAWVRQQIHDAELLRLRDAARELYRDVEALDAAVRTQAARCVAEPGASCTPDGIGIGAVWVWSADRPAPGSLVAVGVPAAVGPATLWFNPSDGGGPIGVFDAGGQRVAWQVDVDALARELEAFLADRSGGPAVRLVGASPGPAAPPDAPFDDAAPAELLLDRPFRGWRLVAPSTSDDAVGALMGRTAWVSPLALVLLVALVLLGATLTLGSAAREIRLSRLQTDFVSSVSHELRTPLTSIRMFVETLQSGRLKDPDKVQECLDLLSQETDRLSRMIERVLGWARMEAGRRVYEREPVAVSALVDGALRALRSQTLLREPVDIEIAMPDGAVEVDVDHDAIVEALLNLLQNAVRYTPAPRRIRVEVSERGRQVGLAVEDNGPGIPKADRRRIFEKFYQVDALLASPTQQGAERGSGLGLSIVRAVVRGHGGSVELDTEVGRGSRFTLWLPRAQPR